MSDRAAILLHCSTLEAAEIRYRAKLDRCNVSSYILNILMRSVDFEERLPLNFPDFTL